MYTVILRKQPRKYLEKSTSKTKRIFKEYFRKLEEDPYSILTPLHGDLKGLHKVSIGNKRIVILIDDKERTVNILAIGSRGDIYK